MIPKYRARRWVVERTHSWMNRFRRLLIRCEKKEDNYIAILHFACTWITYNREGVSGYTLIILLSFSLSMTDLLFTILLYL